MTILASILAGLAPSMAQAAANQVPTSFVDLYQNRHGIAAGAWAKIHAAVTSKNQPLPTIQTFVGPNTKPTEKTTTSDLQGLFNYFPNNGFIKNVDVIFFNKKDIPWATDKATTLMGPVEVQKEMTFKGMSPSANIQQASPSPLIFCWDGDPNGCESADSWVGADGTAYLGIGVPSRPQTNDNPGYKVQAVALYYAMWLSSYIQNNSIVPLTPNEANKNLTNANFPPYWMYNADEYWTYAIGSAGGSANSLENNIKNNSKPALDMIKHNDGGIAQTFGKTFNLAWINNFLDIKNMTTTWRQMDMMGNIGFTFGPRVMQIMIAIKGPAVMFDLTNLMSQGSTFDQAFQKEFGVNWMSAEPTIAKTILDEYQSNY
jgi:hypothetical protein